VDATTEYGIRLLFAFAFVGLFFWAAWLTGGNGRRTLSGRARALRHLFHLAVDILVFQIGLVLAGLYEFPDAPLGLDPAYANLMLLFLFSLGDFLLRFRMLRRAGVRLFAWMAAERAGSENEQAAGEES
jgi:hypothetical protein